MHNSFFVDQSKAMPTILIDTLDLDLSRHFLVCPELILSVFVVWPAPAYITLFYLSRILISNLLLPD